MQKIVTFLWFNDQAKEAVDLYVSLFENAKITNTSYLTESVAKAAGKKPGDVSTIDFELNGQNFTALNGGPVFTLVRLFLFWCIARPKKKLTSYGKRYPKAAKKFLADGLKINMV